MIKHTGSKQSYFLNFNKGQNMKLCVNLKLPQWGVVSVLLNISNHVMNVKSIELLEDSSLELNDGYSFLDYKNLSTHDLEAIKHECNKTLGYC